uniref:B3 domain-containing protein n=1 Tax=Quercus lobata TaxID=97700 RepID=A0A7N2L8I4_QUELO
MSLLENMGIHDMEGHTIAPNWTPFDALVEVSIVARKKFHKFHRLFLENSLKKPISVEETMPVQNMLSRFGDQDDDDDDQDCCFELETKKNKPILIGHIVLIQWDMPKDTGNTSSTYALRSTWNYVQKSNGLEIDDVVQLWSFRVDKEACDDAASSNTNKGRLCVG